MASREPNELILADLIQIRANRNPDLDVFTFEHLTVDDGESPDEVRTFADLVTNANRIAAGWIAKGIEPGDRIALMMRNHPEFIEAMVAASQTGALFVPIDSRSRGEKLAFMLRNSGCVGMVTSDACLAVIAEIRDQVPNLTWIAALESGDSELTLADHPDVEPLAEVLAKPAATVDVRVDSPAAPLQIMYTSGTTGDPKGIVGANARVVSAGILGHIFGYSPDERPYTGLSFTHGNAQSVSLMPAISLSLRAVFSRRFTKTRLWEVCRAYGCTTFSILGGMATAIYSEPRRADDADNPVRRVVSGGMPAVLWQDFEKRFGVRICEFYGAMDGGGMAFKPLDQGPIGSFGRPMPGLEMKILDEHDVECPPGVVGEICTRPADGSAAPVEYYGDPEASAKKIRRGWNRSGDMGHRDADGWLFFDYRSGGGIRHNGDFVNPSYVEKAIAEHPSVVDVYVYGVPAASGAPGEKDVVGAVVLTESKDGDVRAIFASCREKLEANFVPSYLQLVDEIPKTASEKPIERILIESFDPSAPNIRCE